MGAEHLLLLLELELLFLHLVPELLLQQFLLVPVLLLHGLLFVHLPEQLIEFANAV